MSTSKKPCRHHDIRIFDGLRSCLACGEVVFDHSADADVNSCHHETGRYPYKQLNYSLGQEIRLLVLHPCRSDQQDTSQDLEYDILHAYLVDKPVYEALSYTWASENGDSSLSASIRCLTTGCTIAITKSCESALRQLRLQRRKRVIWVDAICIDQANIYERSHQVNFMSVIYSSASQVLMYLGPGSVGTDRVMDFLNGAHHSGLPIWDSHGSRFVDILRFLQRRYFDRVWVLQEIALARITTLVVGDKTARWSASSIKDLQAQFQKSETLIPSALRWHHASEPERDLLKVLQKSRNCSASDPRDKVYAVLGLVQPDAVKDLLVDYSSSVEEVYTNVAKHIITQHGCLNLLKHIACDPARLTIIGTRSTWVPQWDLKSHLELMPTLFSGLELQRLSQDWYLPPVLQDASRLRNFDAMLNHFIGSQESKTWSMQSTADWYQSMLRESVQSTTKILSLLEAELHSLSLYISYKLDRDFHYRVFQCHKTLDSAISDPHLWSPRPILRVQAHYLDTVTVFSTFATTSSETLTGNLVDPRNSVDSRVSRVLFPFAVGSDVRCSTCSADGARIPCKSCTSTPSAKRDWSSNYQKLYSSFCDGLGSLVTANRFVTIRSAGASVAAGLSTSDTIWAIDSADVPFILRRIDDHYLLVGPCYLYGATKSSPCGCCGRDSGPWQMVTQIIDIW